MRTNFSVSRQADQSGVAGAARTMIRLLAGANLPIYVYRVGVFFDSTASSDHQAQVNLKLETTPASPTGTSVTPLDLSRIGTVSYVTSTVKCTAEGSGMTYSSGDLENWLGPATSGIMWEYSLGNELIIPPGNAFRVVVTMPTTQINITDFAVYAE